MSLQEELINRVIPGLPMQEIPIPQEMNQCNDFATSEEDFDNSFGDVIHKVRIIHQHAAKPILVSSEQELAELSSKKRRVLKIDEDEDDLEAAAQFDILTKVSTSYTQSSTSRANSAFSGQEELCSVGEYKEIKGFSSSTSLNVFDLTLEQIISDAKSGIPSLNEEKARQQKILKQRQQKNMKSCSQSSESLEQITLNTIETQAPSQIDPKLVKEKLNARINGSTFNGKKSHTKKWSEEETLRFFKGLQVFGTDFSLIQKLFPERTRAQIKNKFRKEEKENSMMVEESIRKNSMRRYNKIQAKLTVEKEKISTITPETNVEERIDLLKQERKRRLNSFESVDSQDIEVAEDVNEIFKRENIPSSMI